MCVAITSSSCLKMSTTTKSPPIRTQPANQNAPGQQPSQTRPSKPSPSPTQSSSTAENPPSLSLLRPKPADFSKAPASSKFLSGGHRPPAWLRPPSMAASCAASRSYQRWSTC
uniref:(northern house mosquito) hypothetical protein n=1 Tax=Culex pipiens TaxID=7175 RepID=A0A8D8KJM3_CULPI